MISSTINQQMAAVHRYYTRRLEMPLHPSTFDYLKPTDEQSAHLWGCREEAMLYAKYLENHLPDGPDKTYILRKVREIAMWVNVAITREADGSPRS